MSLFEWLLILALGLVALAIFAVASSIDKHTRHLSNIADRLLDIDRTLGNRR